LSLIDPLLAAKQELLPEKAPFLGFNHRRIALEARSLGIAGGFWSVETPPVRPKPTAKSDDGPSERDEHAPVPGDGVSASEKNRSSAAADCLESEEARPTACVRARKSVVPGALRRDIGSSETATWVPDRVDEALNGPAPPDGDRDCDPDAGYRYSYAPRVHVVLTLPSLSTSYGEPRLTPAAVLDVR